MPTVFADKSLRKSGLIMIGDAYRDTTTYRHNGGSMRVASQGAIRGMTGRAYAPESSDFTLEFWLYPTAYASPFLTRTIAAVFGTVDYTFLFGLENTNVVNRLMFRAGNDTSTVVTCNAPAPLLNQWSHVAAERYGNTFTCYVNGVPGTGVTYAGTIQRPLNENVSLVIGMDDVDGTYPSTNSFSGPIDSGRYTIGEARYKGAFTPSNDPFVVGPTDPLWDKTVFLADGTFTGHGNTVVDMTTTAVRLVPSLPTQFKHLSQLIAPRDIEHGGKGMIYGTISNKGTPNQPVYRRVRLIRDRDGICIRETWSHPTTGAYAFDNIDEHERYTVLSYDHTDNYRAVVGDKLIPEVMA